MRIIRTEYKVVTERAVFEFTEVDLKDLNDYLISLNPDFVPLTMVQIENATEHNIEGRIGEMVSTHSNYPNYKEALNDFILDWIDEMCWDQDFYTVDITVDDVEMEFEYQEVSAMMGRMMEQLNHVEAELSAARMKVNKLCEYIFDICGGNYLTYSITLYGCGFTEEDVYDELTYACGLDEDETEKIMVEVKNYV